MDEIILEKLESIFFCYLNTVINITGAILSLFCFIIFLNSQFSDTFYKYKKVEIIFIGLSLFSYGLRPFVYCKDSVVSTLYISQMIHLINRYVRSVFETTATLCCILSSLYFYLKLIKSKFNILSRVSYKLVSAILLTFSAILFLYRSLEFKIDEQSILTNSSKYDNNETIQLVCKLNYKTSRSDLFKTFFFRFNRIASFLIADGILVFILMIINMLSFIEIKKSLKAKKYIHRQCSTIKMRSNIKNAENSIKIMVFVGSFITIIGKFPLFIYYLLDTLLDSSKFEIRAGLGLLSFISYTIFSITYSINYVLFFFLNKTFKKVFLDYLSRIIKCFNRF